MIRRVPRSTTLDLIYTTSREGAESFTWPEPFAMISITDPGSTPLNARPRNLVASLRLQFWDLVDDPGDGPPVFDSDMARDVLEFVDDGCVGAKTLVIHCEAGISRSTGMANALGRVHGVEVRHENVAFANPNPLAMRVISEVVARQESEKAS